MIHKRYFKACTTYHFACLIFLLCRETRLPIWHGDTFRSPMGTFYIGLIKDKADIAAPRREPSIDVPILSEELAYTMELDQGANCDTSDPTDTTPTDSIHATSRSPAHLDLRPYM